MRQCPGYKTFLTYNRLTYSHQNHQRIAMRKRPGVWTVETKSVFQIAGTSLFHAGFTKSSTTSQAGLSSGLRPRFSRWWHGEGKGGAYLGRSLSACHQGDWCNMRLVSAAFAFRHTQQKILVCFFDPSTMVTAMSCFFLATRNPVVGGINGQIWASRFWCLSLRRWCIFLFIYIHTEVKSTYEVMLP